VPLLVENRLQDAFDVIVTVSSGEDARVARLAADRGMDAGQARARIAAQRTDADREAIADEVLRNDGSLEDLARQVDELWKRLAVAHR
jgi:dephospho-CoA kinase